MSFNSWRSLCLGCALFYFFPQLAPLVWGDAHYCCVYWNPSPQDDAPRALITQAKLSAKANDSMWKSKYTCMGNTKKNCICTASTKSLLLHLQLWTTKVNTFELSIFFCFANVTTGIYGSSGVDWHLFWPQNPSFLWSRQFFWAISVITWTIRPRYHIQMITHHYLSADWQEIQLQLQIPRCKYCSAQWMIFTYFDFMWNTLLIRLTAP